MSTDTGLPARDKIQLAVDTLDLAEGIDQEAKNHRKFALNKLLDYVDGKMLSYYRPKCHCGRQIGIVICNREKYFGRLAEVCSNKDDSCGHFKFRGWKV